MMTEATPGSAAAEILAVWDRVKARDLPADWVEWRVPLVEGGQVARSTKRDNAGTFLPLQHAPSHARTVIFKRVQFRPHVKLWTVIVGRYQETEIIVERTVV